VDGDVEMRRCMACALNIRVEMCILKSNLKYMNFASAFFATLLGHYIYLGTIAGTAQS
jgi:hypothetical protein